MNDEINFEEAFRRASSLCAASEKCSYDISTKLKQWGAGMEVTKQVLTRLVDEHYIDEIRFAKFYVKDKFRFNQWGKIKIRLMLQARHIDADVIDEALDSIDEDEYRRLLLELMRRKLKGLKFSTEFEKQGKLIRFALGRGFENRTINEVYRELDD